MDEWQRRRLWGVKCVILTLLCFIIEQVLPFNLETRLPVIKEGAPGAYFGFSVAEHQTVDDVTGEVDASW